MVQKTGGFRTVRMSRCGIVSNLSTGSGYGCRFQHAVTGDDGNTSSKDGGQVPILQTFSDAPHWPIVAPVFRPLDAPCADSPSEAEFSTRFHQET